MKIKWPVLMLCLSVIPDGYSQTIINREHAKSISTPENPISKEKVIVEYQSSPVILGDEPPSILIIDAWYDSTSQEYTVRGLAGEVDDDKPSFEMKLLRNEAQTSLGRTGCHGYFMVSFKEKDKILFAGATRNTYVYIAKSLR